MQSRYDVVIAGGGVNGLACAAMLAAAIPRAAIVVWNPSAEEETKNARPKKAMAEVYHRSRIQHNCCLANVNQVVCSIASLSRCLKYYYELQQHAPELAIRN